MSGKPRKEGPGAGQDAALRGALQSVEDPETRRFIERACQQEARRQDGGWNERNEALTEFIDSLDEGSTKIYIEKVLLPTMDYLSQKSHRFKLQYLILSGSGIVLGALITIVTAFSQAAPVAKALLAVMGAASTAVSAFLALLRSKDQWVDHRITRENLLQHLYAYFCDGDEFAGLKKGDQEAKDHLLFQLCENELSNVVGNWRSRIERSDPNTGRGN